MPMGVAKLVKNYWHIPIVPESVEQKATQFRVHDVGRKGRAQRLSALINGKWQTVSWHMHKNAVYVTDNTLVSTDPSDQKILEKITRQTGKIKVDKILLPYQIKAIRKGGWFAEQYRHALARKGIKTGRKKKWEKRLKKQEMIKAIQETSLYKSVGYLNKRSKSEVEDLYQDGIAAGLIKN